MEIEEIEITFLNKATGKKCHISFEKAFNAEEDIYRIRGNTDYNKGGFKIEEMYDYGNFHKALCLISMDAFRKEFWGY